MKKLLLLSFFVAGLTVWAARPSISNPIPLNRPNVLVIVSDDQRTDTLGSMPIVGEKLINKGISFTKAFVPNSLCCPSRTSTLTGNYSHTTGVYRNEMPYGGFPAFNDSSTLATWLKSAGYKTGLVGKYLNGYNGLYIPPGWDRWVTFSGGWNYFNYDLNINGAIEHHGSLEGDYSTDVFTQKMVDLIHQPTVKPLFLWYSPYAPHAPATPAPRHVGMFSTLPPSRPPNYNEADVSDKPQWVQNLSLMTLSQMFITDNFRKKQYESLQALDEGVGAILNALEETGRLENTIIFYFSDNGLSWGEHRKGGKQSPYEEDQHVPMVIRYDELQNTPRIDDNLVLNIDLAPTIIDLINVSSSPMEGISLLPLLNGQATSTRSAFCIEHMLQANGAEADYPVDTFVGVRTPQFTYVHYNTGELELYDLNNDPFELNNIAYNPSYQSTVEVLEATTMELCTPLPPDW